MFPLTGCPYQSRPMTDYTKLIAALEAAEEPSRELDYHIHAAQLGSHFRKFSGGGGLFVINNLQHGIADKAIPLYTSSIDAALSFTPEGWALYRINQYHMSDNPAWGWGALLRYHVNPEARMAVGESNATPAIAICIANFKALEAQEEG